MYLLSALRKRALAAISLVLKLVYRVVLLLRLYVVVLEREAARAGGSAGDDSAQSRIDDGAAWIDFCDSLKGLADHVVATPYVAAASRGSSSGGASSSRLPGLRALAATHGAAAVDALDRREGLRYMTRIMRGGLEAFMDCWDPAWPVLRPLPYNVKMGADNPDNLYLYSTVSGAFEYRIYGSRGSVTYLSFGCYSGSRPGQGSTRPDHLDSSRLATRPDGSFEIFLTPEPRGGNWLRLPPDASRIVVRQTFLDRSKEAAAEVNIERLPLAARADSAAAIAAAGAGAAGAAGMPLLDSGGREVKPPLSAGQVVAGLAGASVFISGSVLQFQTWSRQFAARPNSLFCLDHDAYMTAWADPAIHFLHGYWRVGAGEALLIQATPPDCPYWNFQLDNWWMESLDYVAHPATTTNKATASYMPDGSICLVVAHSDPRVAGGGATGGGGGGRGGNQNGGGGGRESSGGGGRGRVSGEDGAVGDAEGKEEEVEERGVESLAELLPPRLQTGVTWIDTAHHCHGTMGLRWVLATQHPVPRCRVVRLGRPLAEAIAEGVAA